MTNPPLTETTFSVPGMDCPSEEQLIRMALSRFAGVRITAVDIPNRQVILEHPGDDSEITQALAGLNLGAIRIHSQPANPGAETGNNDSHLLKQVLAINLVFFFAEGITGLLVDSVGLMADSLDMLADATIYTMALMVISSATAAKNRVAFTAGAFQLILAGFGFAEVISRVTGSTPPPDVGWMMGMALLALLANSWSLQILNRSKSVDSPMRASVIFTSTDVIANAGVILAGGLVWLTGSVWPDLLVASIIFALVVHGAWRLFSLAR